MWWPWDDPAWQTGESSSPGMEVRWSGFVLNPLALALPIWLAVVLPLFVFRTIRRRMRRYANRCVQCGYPIGTAASCTECGSVVGTASPAA